MAVMARPRSVAIVAMGRSHGTYCGFVAAKGDRRRVVDEVWTVNSMAAVVQHDRAFVMDDLRRCLELKPAEPVLMAHGLLETLKAHPGPIYTSTAYPDEYPGSVEYPLADVLAKTGVPYLNTTVAYAAAYALALEVPEVHFYGCDFSYADNFHAAEAGRANVELIIGLMSARHTKIVVAQDSSLMHAAEQKKFYGYVDPLRIDRSAEGVRVYKGEDEIAKAPNPPGYNPSASTGEAQNAPNEARGIDHDG